MNFLKIFFQWNNSWKLCKFTFYFFFELPISSHVSWNLFLTSKEAEKKNILIATKCTSTAATPSGAPYGADLFDSFFLSQNKNREKRLRFNRSPQPPGGCHPSVTDAGCHGDSRSRDPLPLNKLTTWKLRKRKSGKKCSEIIFWNWISRFNWTGIVHRFFAIFPDRVS